MELSWSGGAARDERLTSVARETGIYSIAKTLAPYMWNNEAKA